MTCEHLICASCAGPVPEGRCAACRTTRSHVHHHAPLINAQALVLVAMIALLLALVWIGSV